MYHKGRARIQKNTEEYRIHREYRRRTNRRAKEGRSEERRIEKKQRNAVRGIERKGEPKDGGTNSGGERCWKLEALNFLLPLPRPPDVFTFTSASSFYRFVALL